jgi:phosphomevalonate kinase
VGKRMYVLISGKRLNGKDTLADGLMGALVEGPKILAEGTSIVYHLADAIKLALMEQFPEIPSIESMHDNSSPVKKKFRPHMIKLGQEMRAVDKDYWCIKLHEIAEEDGADLVIVPDTRFSNEINYFKELDDAVVYTIRIETVLQERIRRGYKFTPGIDDDISELSLDLGYEDMPWDALLVDTGFGVHLYKEPHKKDITASSKLNKTELFQRTLEILPDIETRRVEHGHQDNNS